MKIIIFFLGGGRESGGGRGAGVRVDVNGEVKFFENSKTNFFRGRVAGGGSG